MSRLVFNSVILVVCIVAIVTVAVILPLEFRRCSKKSYISIKIIAIILAVALSLLVFLSLDYTGTPCITGEIVEIKTLGSFAGIYDRYKIVIVDNNGITREVQSVFPVNGNTSDIIDCLKNGDSCEVFGSTLIDAFFYSINLTK